MFGTITSHSGSSTNCWLFTGEQHDQASGDTGYYFLRARYYDPTLGRFISRDTLLFEHRYVYASNNPLLLVDPTGLCDGVSFLKTPFDCLLNAGETVQAGVEGLSGVNDVVNAVLDHCLGDLAGVYECVQERLS